MEKNTLVNLIIMEKKKETDSIFIKMETQLMDFGKTTCFMVMLNINLAMVHFTKANSIKTRNKE